MSISKPYTSNKENITKILRMYLEDDRKFGYQQIADNLGTRYANVLYIVNKYVDGERKSVERSIRMSRSKLGALNPGHQKKPANYIGTIGDGNGYLQKKENGKYVLEHRSVVAKALGIKNLPSSLDVHHIDGNKQNNELDNLALVTRSGHQKLHTKLQPYQRLPLWEQWTSGTLKLPMTTRTVPED